MAIGKADVRLNYHLGSLFKHGGLSQRAVAHCAPLPPGPPCLSPQELSRRVTQAMQEAHSKSVAGMKEKMRGLAQNLGLPGLPGQ